MTRLRRGHERTLKDLRRELQRLCRRLRAAHAKTRYEDLLHAVLALQIADHAVEEALQHTGLGGRIQREPNAAAHRQALRWHKVVSDVGVQGGKLLRTHPSEDLETALKALMIAAGSFEEVAEHCE
jgi:hypothetical protein